MISRNAPSIINIPKVVVPTNNADDPDYVVSAGSFDGVVQIGDGNFTGSGVLLSSGRHILTAAHVVADMTASDIAVAFDLTSGRQTLSVSEVHVHPNWNSDWGYDIAIIELTEDAPATGYEIYRGSSEIDSTFSLVGYGSKGTGTTGEAEIDPDLGLIKRTGNNTYEAFNEDFAGEFGNAPTSSMLFYDFDDGTEARDALGQLLGKNNTGLGSSEVNSAGGDSGGPNFISVDGQLQIAGIVSGGNDLGTDYDILAGINSSFGEISHDTRVSFFADWIDSITNATVTTTTFTPYDSTTMTAMDLADKVSGELSGVTVTDAVLIGTDAQTSLFDSLDLGNGLTMGAGVLLTSGDGTPPESNTESGYSQSQSGDGDDELTAVALAAFEGAGSTNDANILELTLNVTDSSISSIALDLIFGSDEFPEYADSTYVDVAAVTSNGSNYGLFSNGKPLSIISDNINFGGITENSSQPIEYDGLTQRLTVIVPVTSGSNTVRIGVADTGDYILDSGLFISNLRTKEGDAQGVKLEVPSSIDGGEVGSAFPEQDIDEIFNGSDFDDVITAGAGDDFATSLSGNNSFFMGEGDDYAEGGSGDDIFEGGVGSDTLVSGGGADTFQGSASDLNGDTIKGFNSQSQIKVQGSTFTKDDITLQTSAQLTNESVVYKASAQSLLIDTDGDGSNDTAIQLEGDFSSAEFNVTQSDGASSISYTTASNPEDNDTFIVQRGIIGKGAGNDVYLVSGTLLDSNAEITISDTQGQNSLQLVDGLVISSSQVANDTALLTFNNGASLTILGASSFSYIAGGNPLADLEGTSMSYSGFVTNQLGISAGVPTSGVNSGTEVTVTGASSGSLMLTQNSFMDYSLLG